MSDLHEELPSKHSDPLVSFLNSAIKIAVKVLAILMAIVIFLGVGDVIYVTYKHMMAPPVMLIGIEDMFKTFAAFLAVLIAIEIYQNIILYLKTDILPIKLVLATALMAIARKVIILDYNLVTATEIIGIAAVILALGITYYLIGKHHKEESINIKTEDIDI